MTPRAMELAQRCFGGTKIAGIAVGLGDMQRHTRNPAPHQHAASGVKEAWRDVERRGARQCAPLAPEQKMGERFAPPRHAVDAAKYRFDVAILTAEMAAFNGGEDVALEHDFAPPSSVQCVRMPGFNHARTSSTKRVHSAASETVAPIQASRSARARAHSAGFCAPRAVRLPSGGNKPKLTFIGWKERAPESIVSMCPPVM